MPNNRPWEPGRYMYAGVAVLSETAAAGEQLSLAIPAPEADEGIFILGWSGKFGHTGAAPLLRFQLADGTPIWDEGLPAQDTWGARDFGEVGLPAGADGAAVDVIASNAELSVGELFVRYQTR